MMTTTILDAPAAPDFTDMRHAMVSSQLRPNAVSDQRVVAAMARVPREAFLPPSVAAGAYRDGAIPLGNARFLNPPMATGRLLTEAYLEATDRVLLIGAATGYTAAVLAQVVTAVVAVESDATLAAMAREALTDTANVTVIEGALGEGAEATAAFDVLVIDGAVEVLPDTLVAQVRPGGRVVTGLIERGVTRLAAGRRSEQGFGMQAFADAECVVLPGFATPQPFRF